MRETGWREVMGKDIINTYEIFCQSLIYKTFFFVLHA